MARSGGGGVGVVESAVIAYNLRDASSWWHDINASPIWQDRIFHALAILYGLVAIVALVQLIRIQLRVPEYGWTTQKVFHFLNFVVNGVRSAVFVFRRQVQKLHPKIVQHILLDMPSLAFFTTYALLVLFWAEIYYQARAVSTDGLRPSFLTVNAVVYVIQDPGPVNGAVEEFLKKPSLYLHKIPFMKMIPKNFLLVYIDEI